MYDRYGKESLDGSMMNEAAAEDIFAQFFGGDMFRGGRSSRRATRTEDMVTPLQVSLEELFNGTTKKISVNRDVLCGGCSGKGAKTESAARKCSSCNGRGYRMVARQVGPGIIQQTQSECSNCQGTGEVIDAKDRCAECGGKKTKSEKKTIEVEIKQGMKHGAKIKLKGEADQSPGKQSGDVVLVLQQKEHVTFRRDGNDLWIEKSIELSDALVGCSFVVKHLDGRFLKISSNPGEILKPGAMKTILGEGMPIPNSSLRGNLHIKFDIVFPEKISHEVAAQLEKLLPRSKSKSDSVPDGVKVQNVRLKEFQGKMRKDEEVDQDDDEDAPQGMQCRPQ
jgi:DnaJ family protein A protein 2